MGKAIGFTGPFADANLGDYGMLLNNILDLRQRARHFEIFSYDPNFVEGLVSDYLPTLSHSVNSVELSEELVDAVAGGYEPTPLEVLAAVANYGEVKNSVSRISTLVVNGGGYLNELWCQPHRIGRTLKLLTPVLLADELGIPIVFTGNGYGPFGERSAFLTRILSGLNMAHFYARDRVRSIAELRKIGVAENRISFVPDDLYVLNDELKQEVEPTGDSPYVVFETYQSLDVLRTNRDALAEFARSMEARGLGVQLLPMYAGRGGEDQANWLKAEFGWSLTSLSKGYLPVEAARARIRGAEFVICDRYHGLVLALAERTPVIHCLRDVLGDKQYYYQKSFGILDTLFMGAPFESRQFMANSPFDAIERVGAELGALRQGQLEAYNRIPSENVENVKLLRERMLAHIIEGSAS